jgi:hypothetical protein
VLRLVLRTQPRSGRFGFMGSAKLRPAARFVLAATAAFPYNRPP